MRKKKYLFYYEEAVDAWIPAPDRIDCIIDKDSYDNKEKFDIQFKVSEMTEEEYRNLPIV